MPNTTSLSKHGIRLLLLIPLLASAQTSSPESYSMPYSARPHQGATGNYQHPPMPSAHADVRNLFAEQQPVRRFTHFRVGNRNVKAMMAEGNIVWVGTSGGVIRYDIQTDKHRIFNVKSGLLANGVFYLGRLRNKLAVGTYGGGLSLMDEKMAGWKNYNVPHGLADAFVYDALEARNGDIWIATWSGANRIVGGDLDDLSAWRTYTVENTSSGLPNDWVYALEEGSDGSIWLATEGGLARYKDDSWSNWSHNAGLGAPYESVKHQLQFNNDPAKKSDHHARQKVEQGLENVDMAYNPNYIVSLALDRSGNVWAGTWGGGLARFDGSTWRNYTMDDGLPANHIFMLHYDERDNLWIGTSNGMARYLDDKFVQYGLHDGLFSNNVFSMAFAGDNSAWVGSFGGVARLMDLDVQ